MFYLFVDHFYFEYDGGTILRRSAQIRGLSRRRLTVYLPSRNRRPNQRQRKSLLRVEPLMRQVKLLFPATVVLPRCCPLESIQTIKIFM